MDLKNYIPALRYGAKLSLGSLQGAGILTFGDTFYVDSVNGSDTANSGTETNLALATLDAAVGKCTANHGDTIFLLPGHAETVTSTNTALDVAGITIIGLGSGLKRPTFTFGAAAATVNVSAANVKISGCHFIANFADVAAAFTLAAAKDFVADSCTFADAGTDLNYFNIFVTGSTNNAADGLTVTNSYWLNKDASAKAFISVLGNLDRLDVTDNFVDTAATSDAAQFITMSSKVCLGTQVLRNYAIILGATGTTAAIFISGSSTTSTGAVADNRITTLDTTTELIFTATLDFAYYNNYYTGTINTSGYIVPAIDSAA